MTIDDKLTAMVNYQLTARGITDSRVLDAMSRVKRHLFVPDEEKGFAYDDRPLFIGSGQTISQPYIVALMTEILDVKADHTILEIGTGSGYQTAILAELGREVYTIERIKALHTQAEERLTALGYKNIHYKLDDGTIGWKEHAPFDRIIVTAAAPEIPERLFSQLQVEGRMVIPVGGKIRQDLQLVIKRSNGDRKIINHGGCLFVPLIGKEGWQND